MESRALRYEDDDTEVCRLTARNSDDCLDLTCNTLEFFHASLPIGLGHWASKGLDRAKRVADSNVVLDPLTPILTFLCPNNTDSFARGETVLVLDVGDPRELHRQEVRFLEDGPEGSPSGSDIFATLSFLLSGKISDDESGVRGLYAKL